MADHPTTFAVEQVFSKALERFSKCRDCIIRLTTTIKNGAYRQTIHVGITLFESLIGNVALLGPQIVFRRDTWPHYLFHRQWVVDDCLDVLDCQVSRIASQWTDSFQTLSWTWITTTIAIVGLNFTNILFHMRAPSHTGAAAPPEAPKKAPNEKKLVRAAACSTSKNSLASRYSRLVGRVRSKEILVDIVDSRL